MKWPIDERDMPLKLKTIGLLQALKFTCQVGLFS